MKHIKSVMVSDKWSILDLIQTKIENVCTKSQFVAKNDKNFTFEKKEKDFLYSELVPILCMLLFNYLPFILFVISVSKFWYN